MKKQFLLAARFLLLILQKITARAAFGTPRVLKTSNETSINHTGGDLEK